MARYLLKPKREGLDMVVEGLAVYKVLTDKDMFPEMRRNLEEYAIRVPEQIIEFRLVTELDRDVHTFLSKHWEIEEK